MTNPVRLFENLKDMYFRYLDSPFDMRYAALVNERRDLLDRDRRIYRDPLIEPVPAYRTVGQGFAQVAQNVLSGSWSQAEIDSAADFINLGLFPHADVFAHQQEVFREVLVGGNDAIVTTGTGSGKTECFLLPIISSLIRESAGWAAPAPRPAQWDWWNHSTAGRRRRTLAPRVSQRDHETRPAAVRALILYPLNALVEDQLGRLRDALDATRPRQWLDLNRHENRIYFGRYTGNTPVSGARTSSNTGRLREELLSIQRDSQTVRGSRAERFFQSLDGAEMWSRWDMQDSPPDILITNYSMLNIMLMRTVEQPIFDQTRLWLNGCRDRLFYLVVDELHTYRGTPGTEVAYLLRVLLDRVGLTPDSDQLRIISSSASLESGASGLDYLERFFARDRRRFRVVGGTSYVVPPRASAPASLAGGAPALAQFGRSTRSGVSAVGSEAVTLHAGLGAPALPVGTLGERVLAEALLSIEAPDGLRLACMNGQDIIPRSPAELAARAFPEIGPDTASDAVDGLLTALSYARTNAGVAPLPMRAHMMLRSLQGLWICSDPGCSAIQPRADQCPAGILHFVPTLTCQCGARVVELLYCEACGDIFFGGYRRETGNPNEWYLSPDQPNLEAAPDLVSLDRSYSNFAVFWPATPPLSPASAGWTLDTVRRSWRRASFEPADGRVGLGAGPGNVPGFLYYVPTAHGANAPDDYEAYPSRCPRCDADWGRRDQVRSPIRTQRTGFQKIAQVLSDALLRDISQPPLSSSRKLVVFSDSRQDAAKLSAGMRFSHYRDTVRQALVLALQQHGAGPQAFDAQCRGLQLSPEQSSAAASFAATHPTDTTVLALAANPAAASLPCNTQPSLSNQQAAQQILQRAASGPFRLTEIMNDVSNQLLAKGLNPAGYSKSVLWTDPEKRRGSWRDLYDWPAAGVPAPKPSGQLLPAQQQHLTRIHERILIELMDVVFASGRRSIESLLLALPTTDRVSIQPRHL